MSARPEQPEQPDELVRLYLRAQNLEHVQRFDEAVDLYERAVAARFDAAGPYDRLISIYRARDQHTDVARIAQAALSSVRTHPEKRAWFEAMRDGAREAAAASPDARGPEF